MYTGYWSPCGDDQPPGHHHHPVSPAMLLAREIDVDTATPSKDGLVGGARPVFLSLEYLVDAGAVSPTVKITTAAGGSSATWSDDAPAEGYTVRQAVLSAAPGTKVTVAVNNVLARLRWCELVCC
ncbi:hypothetical protein [Caulobacter sp. BK020]|uniref:hypothetical protein n=1 Tax=Caulobacter sp. BK020 TaxID=2512117 RepID=UPI00104FFCC3|nr:hypothetical protein [Caulobacter sp. BK020]TCS11932.1 hypothetical protein EV278_11644 [Caulobacter sp. BK020]